MSVPVRMMEDAYNRGENPMHGETALAADRRRQLRRKRSMAKWGMVGAMGVLALTGYLKRTRQARTLHAVAGVALLGLSYWHHTLYVNDPRPKD